MTNPFVHVELQTTDPKKAQAFYKKLFRWKFQPIPKMNYTIIDVGKGTGGGLMKHPMPGGPSSWRAYVQVENAAASTKKAKALGATILVDTEEVPGYGWLSVIIDPTGAALGLWQPKARRRKRAQK
ncbi:MAG: VOC family protein [Nitrospirae bacterium]|nr:VOC family protein [Nitrospirota bacterium]